jgi:hypothetical protein
MNTSKLKDALLELRAQRTVLDGAISGLEKIIAAMNGGPEQHSNVISNSNIYRSYVDFAVSVLENRNKPMSTKDLTFEVTRLKGKDVSRASLEATLFKHIQSEKENARIEKVGPGFYALPSWPQETKNMWSQITAKQ